MKKLLIYVIITNMAAILLFHIPFPILNGSILIYGIPLLILILSIEHYINNPNSRKQSYYQSLLIPLLYIIIMAFYTLQINRDTIGLGFLLVLIQGLITLGLVALINLIIRKQ